MAKSAAQLLYGLILVVIFLGCRTILPTLPSCWGRCRPDWWRGAASASSGSTGTASSATSTSSGIGRSSMFWWTSMSGTNRKLRWQPTKNYVITLKRYYFQSFADFLTPMMEFDPANRATAAQCLTHPFLADM